MDIEAAIEALSQPTRSSCRRRIVSYSNSMSTGRRFDIDSCRLAVLITTACHDRLSRHGVEISENKVLEPVLVPKGTFAAKLKVQIDSQNGG